MGGLPLFPISPLVDLSSSHRMDWITDQIAIVSFHLGRVPARIGRNMRSTVRPAEVQQAATQRVERLRLLSFAEVSALPERQEEIEEIRSREVAVATYREVLPDARIRVVVQAYFHRFLGIGTMAADGFIIASDGTHMPVPEEMMWEFV